MKTKQILIALGALLVLSGCNRSDLTPGMQTIRLSARVESGETRATINGATGAFAWETGDVIAVHLSTGYANLELTAAGTGELSIANGASRDGYAIFPANVAAGTATAPVVSLPTSYTITGALSSTSSKLPMIAVNDPDSDILYFHHVGTILRLTVNSVPAGTTDLTVTLGSKIAGSFTVTNPESATPTISTVSTETAAEKTVTFTIAGTGGLATATSVVLSVPLPCGTYEGGVSVNTIPSATGFPAGTTGDFTLNRAEGRQLTVTP